MGPIILYTIITLWLAVMALAVAAPFFTKPGAVEAPKVPSIQFRRQSAREPMPESLEDRAAA